MPTIETQPRHNNGQWGEKPDVGLARRLTDELRAQLGHDGQDAQPVTDIGQRLAEQEETVAAVVSDAAPIVVDLDARLAAQLAVLDGLEEPPADAPAEADAPAGELVGAGKSVEQMLADQDAALAALEAKALVPEESLFSDEDVLGEMEFDGAKIRAWDPNLHPRDKHGRFATIGSSVSLPSSAGGGEAQVIAAAGNGNIRVRKADGSEVTVLAKDTTVTRSAAANAAHQSFQRAGQHGGFGTAAAPTRAAGAGAPDAGKPAAGSVDQHRVDAAATAALAGKPLGDYTPAELAAARQQINDQSRTTHVDRVRNHAARAMQWIDKAGKTPAAGDTKPKGELIGVAKLTEGIGSSAQVTTPDGVAKVTRISADQWQVEPVGNSQVRRGVLALGGRLQVIGHPAGATPTFKDGSKVSLPDGTIGTVVSTGPKGVGVRNADGSLLVHQAHELKPATNTANVGATTASAVAVGDKVSWHDPAGNVSGNVEKVSTNGKVTTLTVGGVDHKLTSDGIVHVGPPLKKEPIKHPDYAAHRPPSKPTVHPDYAAAREAQAKPLTREEAVRAATLAVSKRSYAKDPVLRAAAINSLADAMMAHEVPSTHPDYAGARSKATVPASAQHAIGHIPTGSGRPMPPATGTMEDPINVNGDLNAAVEHLANGLHVRLNQPNEVTTLLDKLSAYVAQAKADGKKAPNFDLCGISVPGTNLFCTESKGIPRAQMPQLSGQAVPGSAAAASMKPGDKEANITDAFRAALEARGVKIEHKTVPASHLRATQNELDGPKVAGMAKAMEAGKIPDKGIFVTRDGYIIDGHHRWAAKVAIDMQDNKIGDVTMPVDVINMDIGAAIDFANAFALSMGIRPKSLGAAAEGVVGAGEVQIAPGQVVSKPDANVKKDLTGGACLLWTPRLRADVAARNVKANQMIAEIATKELDVTAELLAVDLEAKAEVAAAEAKAARADRNRGNAENLRRYWTHGEGAAKIGWGTKGDHDRCVALLVSEAQFAPEQAHGYCNLREKEATGLYPAQHAALTKQISDALGLGEWLPAIEAKATPDPAASSGEPPADAGSGEPPDSSGDASAKPPPAKDDGKVANTNPAPTGVMVALYPPDDIAQALHLDSPKAEDVSGMHVTLCYLGNITDVGIDKIGDLVNLVRDFAADSYDQPFEVAGIGRWATGDGVTNGEDSTTADAFVALIDGPELPDLRADLDDALTAAGFDVRDDHGFTPHITLAYLAIGDPSPLERLEALPGTFGWLSVAVGPDVWDFPLAADDQGGTDPNAETAEPDKGASPDETAKPGDKPA